MTLVEESHVLQHGVLLTAGIIFFYLDLNMHNLEALYVLHSETTVKFQCKPRT